MLAIVILVALILFATNKNEHQKEFDIYSLPSVIEAQMHLQKAGYYSGVVDGIAGIKFSHAYMAYSHDYEENNK